jgi:hypothetical protein
MLKIYENYFVLRTVLSKVGTLQSNLFYDNGTQQLLALDNIKMIIELGQLSNRNHPICLFFANIK